MKKKGPHSDEDMADIERRQSSCPSLGGGPEKAHWLSSIVPGLGKNLRAVIYTICDFQIEIASGKMAQHDIREHYLHLCEKMDGTFEPMNNCCFTMLISELKDMGIIETYGEGANREVLAYFPASSIEFANEEDDLFMPG